MNIIKQVKENIKKNVSRVMKYKDLYLSEEGDLLLLNDNIKLKTTHDNNEVIKKNRKDYGNFAIPAKFISYTLNNKCKIKICKKFKNILKLNDEVLVESDLVREVTEKGFNYYL